MAKQLFFVLLMSLFVATMEGGQVRTGMAPSFGVHSAKLARHFLLMPVACNSSKRRFLTSVEIGSGGEERIIVHYLEYDANSCPSSPPPVETVIGIHPPHFETAPSSPCLEGRNNSSPKNDGIDHGFRGYPGGGPGGGGGGGGPDGGGGGPGGGEPDSDRNMDVKILKKIHAALKKLAKTSIFISAQTGTTLLFVAGGCSKSIKLSIVAIIACSYLFCLFSFVVRESKPLVGAIISAVGSLLSALGFLLTMSLIIPPEFIWLFVISAILLFFSLSVLSFL